MKTDEIMKKSISGAKWTVFLSVIAMPVSYATNIILGRASPEALGIYGLLNIFILSITTFILFGGSNVVIKYLPEIDRNRRVLFLRSYFTIISFIALFTLGSIYVYPRILELLFGEALLPYMLPYLILFMFIIIIYSIFDFVLTGLMEIKASISIKQVLVYGNFVVFSLLFFLSKDFFREHLWMTIWGISFISYTIISLLAFFISAKSLNIMNLNKGESQSSDRKATFLSSGIIELKNIYFYLPAKFWSFAFFIHLSTIISFVNDKLDQLFIIRYFNIHEFGLYFAALQTAMLIRYIPILIGNILLPAFSNLLASNEVERIQKAYQEIVRYNTLIVITATLACIFFSKEIIGIFGVEYIKSHLVLVALSCFFSTSSIGVANNALIIAKGRAGIYLLSEIAVTAIGIVLIFFLTEKLGVLGLAIGKGVTVALWQLVSSFIATMLLGLNIKIPRSYKVGIATSFIASILYLFFEFQNILVHTGLFLSCLILFTYFAGYSKKDLDFVIKQLI